MHKVCLVTEELADVGRSGGIGAAFKEMAIFLSLNGFQVDILYHEQAGLSDDAFVGAQNNYAQHGIKLEKLNWQNYVDVEASASGVSYAVYKRLADSKPKYDFIHFHDYKGIGFFSCAAKRHGLAFSDTQLVVQVHGPTRWTIDVNSTFFTHQDQLVIDWLERKSLAWADLLVAPSKYIADWVNRNFFYGSEKTISVIKNLCRSLTFRVRSPFVEGELGPRERCEVNEIVFFGRHEARKGIAIACDALDRLSTFIERRHIKVSFLGAPGNIGGQPSAIYFVEKSKKWGFPVNFHFGLGRTEAARYLASSRNSLLIIPSPVENSPYTVYEALLLNKPVICSSDGGGIELIHPDDRESACCKMTAEDLAIAIERVVSDGVRSARPSESIDEVEKAWLAFHTESFRRQSSGARIKEPPLITVGITHFERPQKLIDAYLSILRQTYNNFEIIVVDDGSSSQETLAALKYIEDVVVRTGGRLIRRENGYLGAARNTILREARGEFVVFLDDDDIARPQMLETLVRSVTVSQADVVTCLNVYMPETKRPNVLGGDDLGGRVSYFPLGGPLSLATEQNVFGSATSLIRRSLLEQIGGYTELKRVGYEDYELYIRLVQSGAKIEICPEVLFFYEVGRPSMISQTDMFRNHRRCFDALRFGENDSSWADYVSLGVGQKVATNSHNRAWWLNSQSKTAEKRLKLMRDNLGIEEYIKIASEIAAEEGCAHLANAFAHGLSFKATCESEHDEGMPSNPVPIFVSSGKPEYAKRVQLNEQLAEVRISIAVGRVEDAVEQLATYCEEHPYLPNEIKFVFAELACLELGHVEKPMLTRLVRAFQRCKCRSAEEDMSLVVLPILIAANDYGNVLDTLERVISDDEFEYKSRYPDIADAASTGSLSPFVHYVLHGQFEGRRGFERSKLAVSALAQKLKKRLSLDDIPAIRDGLKEKVGLRDKVLEAIA